MIKHCNLRKVLPELLPREALSRLNSYKVTVGYYIFIKDIRYISIACIYSFLERLLPVTCYLLQLNVHTSNFMIKIRT